MGADAQHLVKQIAALGPKTGAAILSFYQRPDSYRIQQKSNHTPLTAADLAAHDILIRELPRIIDLPCTGLYLRHENPGTRTFSDRLLRVRTDQDNALG